MNRGMVIVGAGEAGVRAAATLRLTGYGGPITIIGAETAAPYERPPLSKAHLSVTHPTPVPIASVRLWSDVDYRPGVSAELISPEQQTVTLTSGEIIDYDKLLLATGARARTLSLPKVPDSSILTLRTLADAHRVRERLRPGLQVVIIGGGFIGLEVAASLATTGIEVHVVEAQARILQRAVPAALAELLAAEHAQRGVKIHLATSVVDIDTRQDRRTITLNDGSQVVAGLIIAGIGAQPNTELADAAGLEVINGIAVDASLCTSNPHIYAAGDCVSFPHALYGGARLRLESWRCAQEQGEMAARNMLGANDTYSKAPWFWSDQFDLGLQIVGLPAFATQTVTRELGERARLLFHLNDTGQLVSASGIAPGNAVARDIRIAEILIERRYQPDPAMLADPTAKLKPLLKQ
ncbi:MAG: FAD-dependent oxidoreductase [Natronospirillum sp.]